MKKGKLKVLLCLLLFSLLLSGCEGDYGYYGKADIPPLVEQWREEVEFYADMIRDCRVRRCAACNYRTGVRR